MIERNENGKKTIGRDRLDLALRTIRFGVIEADVQEAFLKAMSRAATKFPKAAKGDEARFVALVRAAKQTKPKSRKRGEALLEMGRLFEEYWTDNDVVIAYLKASAVFTVVVSRLEEGHLQHLSKKQIDALLKSEIPTMSAKRHREVATTFVESAQLRRLLHAALVEYGEQRLAAIFARQPYRFDRIYELGRQGLGGQCLRASREEMWCSNGDWTLWDQDEDYLRAQDSTEDLPLLNDRNPERAPQKTEAA